MELSCTGSVDQSTRASEHVIVCWGLKPIAMSLIPRSVRLQSWDSGKIVNSMTVLDIL